jgi:transglutaminase-like putative cysteine protease
MRHLSLLLGGVAVAASALLGSPVASGEDAAATRTFKFTYTGTIPAPAAGSKKLEAWLPLPREDELQKVTDLKVDTGAVAHTVETDAEFGNRMVHLVVDNPTADVAITWSATIERSVDRGQGAATAHPRFLQPDKSIPLTGTAESIVKDLQVKDTAKPMTDRAKKIYDYVLTTTIYSKEGTGWGQADFERACKECKGNCTDFHAKFMGIARAAGIPSRFTMGYSIPAAEPKGAVKGYHCWAHYQDGDKWVPVDISEAQKIKAKNEKEKQPEDPKVQWFFHNLDADRMSMTIGRDLTLTPRQQGPTLGQLVWQYVEVDGKPVDVPADKHTAAYENVK